MYENAISLLGGRESIHSTRRHDIFNLDEVRNLLRIVYVWWYINHTILPKPRIKLEYVDLCGIGGVEGWRSHHTETIPRKKWYFTAFLALLE